MLARLVGVFFDKLSVSIHLIFDRELTGDNISDGMASFELVLVMAEQNEIKLEIQKERIVGTRKILFFAFGSDEVDQAKMKISAFSKLRDGSKPASRRLQEEDKQTQSEMRRLEGEDPNSPTFTQIIDRVSFYKTPTVDTYLELASSLSVVLRLSTGISLFLYLPGFMRLTQMTQIISMVRFMDIDLPINSVKLIRQFEKTTLTMIPSPIKTVPKRTHCQPHIALIKAGVDCYPLESALGALLINLSLVLVLRLVLWSLYSCFDSERREKAKKGSKSKLGCLLKALNQFISTRLLVYLILSYHIEGSISSLAALRYLKIESTAEIMNKGAALASIWWMDC